jgi:hypothetical protein
VVLAPAGNETRQRLEEETMRIAPRQFRSQAPFSVTLSALTALAALAACTGDPLATRDAATPPLPAFELVPIVPLLAVISPHSDVMVDFGVGDPDEAEFHAWLLVLENGGARGEAKLNFKQPDNDAAIVGVVLAFSGANVREADGRITVLFGGKAEVCLRDGDCETVEMTGEVRQEGVNDDPVPAGAFVMHSITHFDASFHAPRTIFVKPAADDDR